MTPQEKIAKLRAQGLTVRDIATRSMVPRTVIYRAAAGQGMSAKNHVRLMRLRTPSAAVERLAEGQSDSNSLLALQGLNRSRNRELR